MIKLERQIDHITEILTCDTFDEFWIAYELINNQEECSRASLRINTPICILTVEDDSVAFNYDIKVEEEWSEWVGLGFPSSRKVHRSNGNKQFLAEKIYDINSVERVWIRDSNTRKVEITVFGGSPLQIAEEIYNNRPTGVKTIGSTSVTFTTHCGNKVRESFNYIYK
jgi:hypothetical protein